MSYTYPNALEESEEEKDERMRKFKRSLGKKQLKHLFPHVDGQTMKNIIQRLRR